MSNTETSDEDFIFVERNLLDTYGKHGTKYTKSISYRTSGSVSLIPVPIPINKSENKNVKEENVSKSIGSASSILIPARFKSHRGKENVDPNKDVEGKKPLKGLSTKCTIQAPSKSAGSSGSVKTLVQVPVTKTDVINADQKDTKKKRSITKGTLNLNTSEDVNTTEHGCAYCTPKNKKYQIKRNFRCPKCGSLKVSGSFKK